MIDPNDKKTLPLPHLGPEGQQPQPQRPEGQAAELPPRSVVGDAGGHALLFCRKLDVHDKWKAPRATPHLPEPHSVIDERTSKLVAGEREWRESCANRAPKKPIPEKDPGGAASWLSFAVSFLDAVFCILLSPPVVTALVIYGLYRWLS